MMFDAQRIFANLAEKERLYGHHSPEGQAIRMLSRALTGWSTGSLSNRDVVTMCNQAIVDWLKRRLSLSAWSAVGVAELLPAAVERRILTEHEARCLQEFSAQGAAQADGKIAAEDVEALLGAAIEIIERHWS